MGFPRIFQTQTIPKAQVLPWYSAGAHCPEDQMLAFSLSGFSASGTALPTRIKPRSCLQQQQECQPHPSGALFTKLLPRTYDNTDVTDCVSQALELKWIWLPATWFHVPPFLLQVRLSAGMGTRQCGVLLPGRNEETPQGGDAAATSNSMTNPTWDRLLIRIIGVHKVIIHITTWGCHTCFFFFSQDYFAPAEGSLFKNVFGDRTVKRTDAPVGPWACGYRAERT